MKPLRSILTAGLALAVLSTAVRAEVFPILEDTAGSPVTNLTLKATGAAKTLAVSARSTAFLSFGVGTSGIDPATVTAARLTIFFPRVVQPGVLTFSNLDSSFAETITGRNAPNPTIGTALGTVDLATTPLNREFLVVDITDQVKAWLTDPSTEFGIAVSGDATATCTLASKEGAGSGHPAIIEVDVNRGGGSLSGTTLALTSTAIVNGNLGIGLMNPARPLHVLADGSPDAPFGGPGPSGASTDMGTASAIFDRNGHNTVAINAGDGRFSQLLFGRPTAANNGSILYNDFADTGMIFSTKQGSMTLTNSGNFGIGLTNPVKRLHVLADGSPDAPFGGPGPSGASTDIGTASAIFDRNGHNTVAINAGDARFSQILFGRPNSANNGTIIYNDFSDVGMSFSTPGGSINLSNSGRVGIGTATPTEAKLVVNGSASFTIGTHGAAAADGYFPSNAGGTLAASIHASNDILASRLRAFSDERIKRVVGRSDAARDLDTLRGIEIADYTYIDTIGKGTTPQKKVIAQQVEKVFPQVVARGTDVVPDIYKLAAFKDGWVELETDLKPGERVRLTDDQTTEVVEVLEVKKGRFRTAYRPAADKVFVYGREVKDFRTVDYEAIAMLNVSATQELAGKLDAKDAEIAALKAANLALAEKMAAFDEKLTALQAERDERAARTVRASLDLK